MCVCSPCTVLESETQTRVDDDSMVLDVFVERFCATLRPWYAWPTTISPDDRVTDDDLDCFFLSVALLSFNQIISYCCRTVGGGDLDTAAWPQSQVVAHNIIVELLILEHLQIHMADRRGCKRLRVPEVWLKSRTKALGRVTCLGYNIEK